MPMDWEELDPRAGDPEARLSLHYAVQPVAAVGQSLAPKAADYSQQSLTIDGPRRWLGVAVAGGTLRAGIDPVKLELLLCDGAGSPLAALPLEGKTVAEGVAFLATELQRRGQLSSPLALPKHPADFPHHPLDGSARFAAGGERARTEVARLFAGTHGLLAELRGDQQAPPRLWPHHFDLGCVIQVGAISLNRGVSPGDGAAGRPYWYATPWPRPRLDRLPALEGGGSWHLEGWIGAELPLARLGRGAAAQREQVAAFFRSALRAAKSFSAQVEV